MISTCPYCRQLVWLRQGFIEKHGAFYHGSFELCSGSGVSACSDFMDCCS